MLYYRFHILFTLCVFALSNSYLKAQSKADLESLKADIESLESRLLLVNKELATTKSNIQKVTKENTELRSRLGAISVYQGDKNEKLIQAISDSRILHEELSALRDSSDDILVNVKKFSQVAQVSDPAQRIALEVAIKKLEVTLLGIKENHNRSGDVTGRLNQAKVISVDSESGLIVLNIGDKKDCATGMTFSFNRGGRPIGEGMVVEVRSHISGVLMTVKQNPNESVKVGDQAKLKVQR